MGGNLERQERQDVDVAPSVADTFASAGNWQSTELAAVLEHQLNAPLAVDLYERLPDGERQELLNAAAASTPPIETFWDLLSHPDPPERLLSLLHAFTHRPNTTRHAGLPTEIARVLDVAMAAGQMLRGKPAEGVGIADLRWLAELGWVKPALRQLAEAAITRATATNGLPGQSITSSEVNAPTSKPLTSLVPEFAPTVDGYAVTGRLGEGGMGVVWRAEQLSTGRVVALKLMSVAAFGSERARVRFEREVRLTAQLEHPQIARVYESGLHRGAYHYAMELVEGLPLDRYVRDHKLNDRQILELMRAVCAPVAYAHQRRIIHRDLKPNNILVGPDGVPHVLDFGLAKAMQDVQSSAISVTLEGEYAGTTAFMAPEQAAGSSDACETTADVYALGVILFHLLAGIFPHDLDGSRLEVLRRIAETEPRRLVQVRPGVDPKLDGLLARALARKPQMRYASAEELGEAIEEYLAGRGVTAPARRRPRRTALLAAAVVLVLAAVLWIAWWQTRPLPPIAGGPWISASVYASPGKPHVLQLNPGTVGVANIQAWRIDWGNGEPLEYAGADARTVQHTYPETGRFKIRVQVQVNHVWHLASTCNGPVYHWRKAEGGNGHRYTLTHRRGAWSDTLDESWSLQSNLVSINSAAEQAFLNRTFLIGAAERSEWYWIGLTERALHRFAGGSYVWLDDSDYQNGYKNWAPGAASDPALDNVASMNYAYVHQQPEAQPGQWSDLRDQDLSMAASGARGIIEFTEDPPAELLAVVTNSGTAQPVATTLPAEQ